MPQPHLAQKRLTPLFKNKKVLHYSIKQAFKDNAHTFLICWKQTGILPIVLLIDGVREPVETEKALGWFSSNQTLTDARNVWGNYEFTIVRSYLLAEYTIESLYNEITKD